MITLLARIFKKKNLSENDERTFYGQLAGIVGMILNLLLFLGKYIIGTITGSISIVADAFNNLSDSGSSLVTLLGFRVASTKPDPEHPYGHGRFEYIAGLIVSGIIFIMGYQLVVSSVRKIIHPEDTQFRAAVVIVLAASILVKFYMAYYNHALGKRWHSPVLNATCLDSLSDTISTFVVLAAAVIERLTGLHLDGIAGLVVAAFILYAAYDSAKGTISPLLGTAPTQEFVDRIREIVLSYPEILGMHDLMVHDYGPGRVIISLHAEVDSRGCLMELHDTIDQAEHRLNQELGCTAVIHMDPIQLDDPIVNETREKVHSILLDIDPRLNMHDFRMVQKRKGANLVFDIEVPYDFMYSSDQIRSVIDREIKKQLGKEYETVITVDKQLVARKED